MPPAFSIFSLAVAEAAADNVNVRKKIELTSTGEKSIRTHPPLGKIKDKHVGSRPQYSEDACCAGTGIGLPPTVTEAVADVAEES